VWSKTLKSGGSQKPVVFALQVDEAVRRHEGSDAGNSERLHGRSSALKGVTPRADPVCNKTGRYLADEGVEGSRKPEDASGHVR
jgi:hypothetical protein